MQPSFCLSPVLIVITSSAAGNLVLGDSPFLSTQQGKLILTFPAGIQLTCVPLKPVSEASPLPANGASAAPVAPQPLPASGSAPIYLTQPSVNFIGSSPPYCPPEAAATAAPSPQTLDHSISPTIANTLTPESMLTLSPMYSGATPTTAQLHQAAWSTVPLSTSAGLTLFDVRGKGDLSVDPGLLSLPGGESLLLGSPSPEQDTEAASALGTPEEADEDPKILTQLQSVPVDDELAL